MASTPIQSERKAFPEGVRRRLLVFGGSSILILVAALVGAYLMLSSRQIVITASSVSAPIVDLAPASAGRLNALYVQEGDQVAPGASVALVGTEVVKAKQAGLVVRVDDTVGAQVAPGAPVAHMIDPSALRVVGKIDENKGLARIKVGDPVVFTVDAFGGEKFQGVVDEVAPTSNESGIVFNISSSREIQQFLVKARFDVAAHPELKNGMSARMYVYPR
jgi:multidrug resistance efflux pump